MYHGSRVWLNRTVYFVRCGDSGPIKIGITQGDPAVRLAGLQAACPDELHLVATMPGSDFTTEKQLHWWFRHYRLRGEWFEPAPELLRYIAENSNLTPRYEWLASECEAVASTG